MVRPPDPDKLAAQATRAARLKPLIASPAWSELRAIVEERRDKHFSLLTRQLMDGVAVDQRYIDRMAGYFKGMEDLLSKPSDLEKQVQRALERAELFKEGDSA